MNRSYVTSAPRSLSSVRLPVAGTLWLIEITGYGNSEYSVNIDAVFSNWTLVVRSCLGAY